MLPAFSVFPMASIALCALVGCNTNDTPVASSEDPDEGRYHAKSFSWDSPAAPAALAKVSAKETSFRTEGELTEAVRVLEGKLADHAFTAALWKPVDYVCDELDLAVWNEYGAIRLADSTVFDENILKARCRLSDATSKDAGDTLDGLGKTSGWQWWKESEVVDRQYPYKMIGRSWDNFNILGYKSTGGETQFEKHRSRFGITAWYDTDATRIGVRIYLFDCGKFGPNKYCYYGRSTSDWYKNDDYVSKREFALGEITIHSNRLPSVRPAKLNGADAVVSLHSVDHAGLQFRAVSSSGADQNVITEETVVLNYVTW